MDQDSLNDIEKDALKELGNVGTGNAATALSKFLNKHIEIIIPQTKFTPIEKFSDEFGGPEAVVVGSYLPIIGDLTGESMFVFPEKNAKKVVDILLGQDIGTTKILDDMGENAFQELSNIFTGAYLNSLADFLSMKILPGVPHITVDMCQAVMDFIIASVSNHSQEILSIKTKIEIKDVEVEGFFVLIFDVASMSKLLNALKDMYGL